MASSARKCCLLPGGPALLPTQPPILFASISSFLGAHQALGKNAENSSFPSNTFTSRYLPWRKHLPSKKGLVMNSLPALFIIIKLLYKKIIGNWRQPRCALTGDCTNCGRSVQWGDTRQHKGTSYGCMWRHSNVLQTLCGVKEATFKSAHCMALLRWRSRAGKTRNQGLAGVEGCSVAGVGEGGE